MHARLEEKIKAFVRSQGVDVVGIAGPDRLDGPPSLDPTYTMKSARSIVSLVLPMDVEAIDDFLGKKSYVPHNLDQIKKNQQMNRVTELTAGYIRSLGYQATPVRANNTYRRTMYPFAVIPSFSHRLGAMAAGIAGQGWSGNAMTEEYGGANYLGTVVTDAVLESDEPRYSPRHFTDTCCKTCKMCDKVCPAQMFREVEEEYVLLNGELHPRAKRNDINLCSASCFGMHAISPDKTFTSWGFGWIDAWMNRSTDNASKASVIARMLGAIYTKGDSAARYAAISAIGSRIHPETVINEYLDKHPEKLAQKERVKEWMAFAGKLGVSGIKSDRLLVCGQCSLVCGPDLRECARRYKLLTNGGLVVLGPDGAMVNAPTYEDAARLRAKRLPNVTAWDVFKDMLGMNMLFISRYTGFEPKSFIAGRLYARRMKKAVARHAKGHKDSAAAAATNPRGVVAPT
ncbi:MAG: hypothetical protein HY899_18040 [Deltaproteobacteria bacterium]|nr:hypothetical protein [Deltaproteobacteria bacterium]